MTLRWIVLAVLLAPPAAALTDAHPDSHAYVMFSELQAGGAPLGSIDVTCFDLLTTAAGVVVSDEDPEFGIGGVCFPFGTADGDDTGDTLRVDVFDASNPTGVHWVACVDVDADGLCLDNGVDRFETCVNNLGASYATGGGPCLVYADPFALDPTLYVIFQMSVPGAPPAWAPATRGLVIVTD